MFFYSNLIFHTNNNAYCYTVLLHIDIIFVVSSSEGKTILPLCTFCFNFVLSSNCNIYAEICFTLCFTKNLQFFLYPFLFEKEDPTSYLPKYYLFHFDAIFQMPIFYISKTLFSTNGM